jgi:hypothetical protein
MVTYRGGNRVSVIRNCECDEFRPYRRIIAGEEEGDDAKMPSLKNKSGR